MTQTDSNREAFEKWNRDSDLGIGRMSQQIYMFSAKEFNAVKRELSWNAWRAATAHYSSQIARLLHPNGIKHPQQLQPEWVVDEVGSRLESLQNTIDHLMACKEFESKLQNEILKVGSKYMNIREGKTYSVIDAWAAIQSELEDCELLRLLVETEKTDNPSVPLGDVKEYLDGGE